MKQMVLDYLDRFKSVSKAKLEELLTPTMASDLSEKQKQDRVKNLLSEMSSKDHSIKSEGRGPGAVWKKV